MPSREFTFFSIILGIDLIGRQFPFADLFVPFLLPLLFMVSGWKYTLAFFGVTEFMAIPFWAQRLPVIQSLLSLEWKIHDLGPDATGQLIKNYTQANTPQSLQAYSWVFPYLAIPIAICLFAFIAFSLWGSYKALRRYIKTLRLVHGVVKRWHR